MSDLQNQMKQAVAEAAVEQFHDGMVVGLGSGSTAALMIKGLGQRLASGQLKNIVGVTTSFQGEVLAAELGKALLDKNEEISKDRETIVVEYLQKLEVCYIAR